jgi:predicted outer membrane repeat protein
MRAFRFARCRAFGGRVSLSSSLARDRYLARLRLEPLEDRRMLSVLFVDADAAPGGGGLAWETAYNDLQPALAQAATLNGDSDPANNIDQIWIAEGTYKPSALLEAGDARSASFSLVNDVILYGGFTGTETTLDQRAWSAHITTLSGDLGTTGDTADNAYTVVYCATGITSGLDGLSITGGNADGSSVSGHPERTGGAGVFNAGTLTVTNSTLSDNLAHDYGGGIDNYNGTLDVTNSNLSDNSARSGGGVCGLSGTLTITNCTLSGNIADGSGVGGGTYGRDGNLRITNCVVSGNAAGYGGGIFVDSGVLTVTNSIVSENSANGVYSRCAGIYIIGTSPRATLNNTIVARNTGSSYPDVYRESGTLSGSYNLIGDGSGQSSLINGVNGNQVGTSSAPIDPLLSDWSQFDSGQWGYYLLPGSPALDVGSDALAVDAEGQPLIEDIAGNVRIQNGTVDVGAVEGTTAGSPAQTYTVTSLDKTIASDGILTFREAFEAANRNRPVGDAPAGSFTEQDVIRFADGLSGTVPVDDRQLVISGDLSIQGPGAEFLTFQANGKNRVFWVWLSACVNVDGMTVAGGSADYGGGIYNCRGTLAVTNCTFMENSATRGGAIYNSNTRTLTVTDCTFSGNSALYGGGVCGSGTVTNCTFSGNSGNYGGGICNYYSGTVTINGCTFSGNSGYSSAYGGGVCNYSSGTVTLNGCTFSGNSGRYGGGIHNNTTGRMTITDSALSGNSASVNGGAIDNWGVLTVDRCTLSGNLGQHAGGIANHAVLTLTNSTISSNVATGSTGLGGGLASTYEMTVTNCTLSDNSAASGGGVYITGDSSPSTLNNTIVAGNTASSGPDVYLSSGTLSGSHNLVGDGSGQTALMDGVNGNQVGTSASPINPMLSTDGRPLFDSPAINKGSNALAVDAQGSPLTVDLDGKPRVIYGTVDIGAYEFRLVADADYSGAVDQTDAGIVAAHWGMSGMTWADGDFNKDHVVNAADASILAANWGHGVSESVADETPVEPVVAGPAGPVDSLLVGPRQASLAGAARVRIEAAPRGGALRALGGSEGDSPVSRVESMGLVTSSGREMGQSLVVQSPVVQDAALVEEYGPRAAVGSGRWDLGGLAWLPGGGRRASQGRGHAILDGAALAIDVLLADE